MFVFFPKLLGKDAVADLLGTQPKVTKWLEAVQEATSPHFFSVSDILLKAADMYQKKRERDQAKQDDSSTKSKL